MSKCGENGHKCCVNVVTNVHQSLDEMEFERGIWGAAQSGDYDRLYNLVLKGDDVNKVDLAGYTALHYAARNGFERICELLLSRGAAVDAQTRAGNATALHRAASAGHLNIVKLLFRFGANAELQDSDGKTVFHRAAEQKRTDVFHYLQTLSFYNTFINIRDNKGNCALDYC